MNKINLVGRLIRDPELKKTKGDTSRVNFTLAVDRNYKNVIGDIETDFINCVAWDKRAETLAKYLKKGEQVAVSGSLEISSYEKENIKQYSAQVNVGDFTFISNKRKDKDEYEEIEEDKPKASSDGWDW